MTIVLENPSTGVDLTNLTLTDDLPIGMVVAASPNGTSSCGGIINAIPGASLFSVSSLSLNAGDSCVFTFDVLATALGDLDNVFTSNDIANDQGIPLSATVVGTLNVFARTVITNRKITYRVKP